MNFFDTIVINLDDSVERLASVTAMLEAEKVTWRRLPAVDGRNGMPLGDYVYDERAALVRHDRQMSGGEVGCFLSHINALRLFLSGEKKHAVILEDDVQIERDFFPKLRMVAESLDLAFNDGWDTFNFSTPVKGFQSRVLKVGGIEVMRSTYMPCGLKGQLWSRAGAISYLESKFAKKLMGPVDREMRSHFARRGRSFIPKFPMTGVARFSSDIDATEDRWFTNGKITKTTFRCKVMRHFPDYLNAYIKLKQFEFGLLN